MHHKDYVSLSKIRSGMVNDDNVLVLDAKTKDILANDTWETLLEKGGYVFKGEHIKNCVKEVFLYAYNQACADLSNITQRLVAMDEAKEEAGIK